MKKLLGVFFVILLLPVCANAIIFTSDANIQAGDSWSSVGIHDTPPAHTTVNMTGGSVTDFMSLSTASTLNMSGGNVYVLNAFNESMVNVSGGSVTILSLYDNATATLLQSGSIGSAGAYDSGIININGGTVTYLYAYDSSILNLRGGVITDFLTAGFSTTINVFGYDLAKTNVGGTYDGQITGFWQDGSQFTINLSSCGATINLIPEPTTILLLGTGIFLLRKSR
ncbi:MAG: PEP-CTERM sorting domain-containing protein [Sedimentisphaerales bacterium]